jgi:hypothetical protein
MVDVWNESTEEEGLVRNSPVGKDKLHDMMS